MGASDKLIAVYVLTTVFLNVQSQYSQNPYTQYGYQPYAQYPPVYNPGYLPYPYYQPQTYQPTVSRQTNYYMPYYNYPAQSYPGATQYSSAYPAQNYYPVVSTGTSSSTNTAVASFPTYPTSSNGVNNVKNDNGNDPYANIKTEIIDVEPKYFEYYKKYFNLEDNSYPINVIDETNSKRVSQSNRQLYQPTYTVKSEHKQTNFSNIPQIINKHDVQTKTFSFKKTFTINPDQREKNAVINLHFVNGVEVTTANPNATISDEETTVTPNTTETLETTTESEKPVGLNSWFS